ncbi:hypothetical protein L208DRAFT_1162408, partial [Tricholoma matsutake]
LPDTIQDFYKENFGTTASQATLTHLKWELMHAIWELILNNKFMEAYEHGIAIKCPDGILQQFYPRFFMYSVDYLEKVLLATIQNLGQCLCPRCEIQKVHVSGLGTTVNQQCRDHERTD